VTAPEVGAFVVGAGIAGLAAALELQSTTREILVIDASDRPGGMLRTDHVSGYVVERGPNTVQVKAPMLALLRRLELDGRLIPAEPESRTRHLYLDGSLQRVPLSPRALAGSRLLSGRAKLRLLAEPFLRRGDASDESVAEFMGRRLGPEVVTRLVGPFLTGLYAGNEQHLGADAVFPGLTDLERRHRSLVIGGLLSLARRGPRGLRGTYSTADGLGPFARHLSGLLVEPPALGTRVTGIRLEGRYWRVSVAGATGSQNFRTRRVVIATPAYDAAQILSGVGSQISDNLASIEYAPIVSIPLGVDPEHVREPIAGFGFLVPREAGLSLLGCLFMSRLFPNRAPQGSELLQCMLGGVRWNRRSATWKPRWGLARSPRDWAWPVGDGPFPSRDVRTYARLRPSGKSWASSRASPWLARTWTAWAFPTRSPPACAPPARSTTPSQIRRRGGCFRRRRRSRRVRR